MSWSPCLPGWLEVRPHVIVVLSLFLSSVSVCLGGANLGPRLWPMHLPWLSHLLWSTWFTEHDLRWRFCDHDFLVPNIPGPDLRATEWRSASGVEARVTEEECGEIKEERHVCVDFSPSFLTDPRSPGPPAHCIYCMWWTLWIILTICWKGISVCSTPWQYIHSFCNMNKTY